MTHSDVLAAITAHGGRLVASFVLDADGETVGLRRTHNRRSHCTRCGEHGHNVSRCNGEGQAPRPTHREMRQRR